MSGLIILIIIGFVGAATPGPDIFLLIRCTIYAGFKEALKPLCGVIFGNLIMLFFVFIGLSQIGTHWLFQMILQSIGGLYLVYISIVIFKNRNSSVEVKNQNVKISFYQGLIFNLSNPKAILFFSIILTPFLKDKNPILEFSALLFGIISAFLIIMYFANKLKEKLLSQKVIKNIDIVASILFFIFGSKLFYDGMQICLKLF